MLFDLFLALVNKFCISVFLNAFLSIPVSQYMMLKHFLLYKSIPLRPDVKDKYITSFVAICKGSNAGIVIRLA